MSLLAKVLENHIVQLLQTQISPGTPPPTPRYYLILQVRNHPLGFILRPCQWCCRNRAARVLFEMLAMSEKAWELQV